MITQLKYLKSPYTKNLIYSTFDQFILSGINLILSYLLLKFLSKTEYGLYNIIIPISLFFTALQNALINTPLMVEFWNRDKLDRNFLVSSFIVLQIKYIYIPFTTFILILLLFHIFTFYDHIVSLTISISVLLTGILSREFLRNYYFTIERPQNALYNDFFYLLFMIPSIVILYIYDLIGINTVLISIGLASLFSSFKKIKSLLIHYDLKFAKQHFSECFQFGKWALLGVIVTHIQTYGYLYLIGISFSPKDIGDISAIRLIFAPFAFITVGYSKIAIPRGSKLCKENKGSKFFQEGILFSIFFSLIIVIYSIVLSSLPKDILAKILKDEYLNSFVYLPYFSISALLSIFGSTGSNGLQALKKFKELSKINSVVMVISFILTIILIYTYGIKGALTANILAQVTNAIVMWVFFYNSRK